MEKINGVLVKAGLRPISRCSLAFYYYPIKGWTCYTLLATQMMAPELYQNFRFLIIPKHLSLTNGCLFNSGLGTALYLFSRPHMAKAAPKERAIFCVFGSTMFNLGSMLLWALGRTVAPDCTTFRCIIGIGGAVGIMYAGKKYVDYLDSQVKAE